jgi:hypothetical protein
MVREALKRELTESFQQSLDQAMDAVEQAPDGQWIAASEWRVRQAFQDLMTHSFERLMQAKLDAADQAAFSPSGSKAGEQGSARPRRAQRRRGDASGA